MRSLERVSRVPSPRVEHVVDRKGHDRRYAMDCGKAAAALGWTPGRGFAEGLAETVAWYLENGGWWGGTG